MIGELANPGKKSSLGRTLRPGVLIVGLDAPVTRWGTYYVYDPANDTRSAHFRIGPDVYEEPLKHAMRMFYYQRRGAAKPLPYADARQAQASAFRFS